MVILSFIATSAIASVAMAGTIDAPCQPGHACGTLDLSPEDHMVFQRQSPQPDDNKQIDIGVAMTFCCSGNDCPSVSTSPQPSSFLPSGMLTCYLQDGVAKKAVEQMNSFYKLCNIQFSLQNTSETQDQRCQAGLENNGAMDNLKSSLHQGNASTLNLVYVSSNRGAGVKGVCVVPQAGTNIPQAIGSKDGCVVASDTLPQGGGGNDADGGQRTKKGGPGGPFSRLFRRQGGRGGGGGGGGGSAVGDATGAGTTSTHEVGHWLGENHFGQNGGGGQNGRNRFSRRQNSENVMVPVSQ